MWKRMMDIVLGSVLLLALIPFLCAVAIFIKIVSRGPVFYTQSRLGAGGKYFVIYKFRTMNFDPHADEKHRAYVESLAESDELAEKPEYSDRLIPFGGVIRKFSIDELPQLLNVLIGNMTLVGPRPDVVGIEAYTQEQLRRFETLPGMTGLWQVSGKNLLSFNRMIELDIEYIEKRTLWLDLKIMYRTLSVVVSSNNS